MTKVKIIDLDAIGQMVSNGLSIMDEHRGYANEDGARRRAIGVDLAEEGRPFSRVEADRDYARELLDTRAFTRDQEKRLYVLVTFQALDAIMAQYWPAR